MKRNLHTSIYIYVETHDKELSLTLYAHILHFGNIADTRNSKNTIQFSNSFLYHCHYIPSGSPSALLHYTICTYTYSRHFVSIYSFITISKSSPYIYLTCFAYIRIVVLYFSYIPLLLHLLLLIIIIISAQNLHMNSFFFSLFLGWVLFKFAFFYYILTILYFTIKIYM